MEGVKAQPGSPHQRCAIEPRSVGDFYVWASQLRILIALMFLSTSVSADDASTFLDQVCKQGFTKTTMPRAEADRFCACLVEDVAPRLSASQRRTLTDTKALLAQGRSSASERLASSGVRELVVAGEARCEAAFYPPSAPINISGGPLQLTLRCEDESKKPEAFVYGRGMALLSKAEQRTVDARMMKGNFEPEYAQVIFRIDGESQRTEKWEIDLTGEIVAPPNPALLIDRLRTASSMNVVIERGPRKYSGSFSISGKIPARWAPCGGVSR